MVTQKLIETYMLASLDSSRVKYDIFAGDQDFYALITVYAHKPSFHIKGYDFLKLDESIDTRSQIEAHFAANY
ncbi:DNA gyrase subunit B [Klebsiella michiganensis]|uniref:DNA gyrase subunit B n=1 Tax=Klebsiella michiganensis TaxID=1134687 RepID=UPI0012B889BD|nr:DNA gyrase subunit B [Klebsiella michiganensis]